MSATTKGLVFDIERFATEDGPGIRTVVFLKGCQLRCLWCANPESQRMSPEMMLIPSSCRMCGACMQACKNNAILPDKEYGLVIDESQCTCCGDCVEACVYDARHITGRWYSVTELMESLLRDKAYYDQSGGGVTFSGGEPLLQADFIREAATSLQEMNIPILVETCGAVPWKSFETTIPLINIIYFDIKHMNSDIHKKLTGSGNENIFCNLKKLDEVFNGSLCVRYPYIPGYNDDETDIKEFLKFCETLRHVEKVVFLPYHRLGVSKYRGLGRSYMLENIITLKKSDLSQLIDLGEKYDLNIEIGG